MCIGAGVNAGEGVDGVPPGGDRDVKGPALYLIDSRKFERVEVGIAMLDRVVLCLDNCYVVAMVSRETGGMLQHDEDPAGENYARNQERILQRDLFWTHVPCGGWPGAAIVHPPIVGRQRPDPQPR